MVIIIIHFCPAQSSPRLGSAERQPVNSLTREPGEVTAEVIYG